MSDGLDAYRLHIEKFEEDDVGKPLNADPAKAALDLRQRVGVGRDSGEDHIDRRMEASREIRVNARIYRRRLRMAHFTLTRSVSEDWCCLLAYASG